MTIHHLKVSGGPHAEMATIEIDGKQIFASRVELVADVSNEYVKAVITIPAVTVEADVQAEVVDPDEAN